MLDKLKAIPNKKLFILGLIMIIAGSLLWFNVWATVARGFLWAFGLLLIANSTKKNTANTKPNNIKSNKVKSNKKK